MSYDPNRIALYLAGKLPPYYKPVDKLYFIEKVQEIFNERDPSDGEVPKWPAFPDSAFDFIGGQAKNEEQFYSMVLNKVERFGNGKLEKLAVELHIPPDALGIGFSEAEAWLASTTTATKTPASNLKPLILTEGKTDAQILKTAWLQLNSGMPFDKKNYAELFDSQAPYRIESCDLYNWEKISETASAANLWAIVNYWKWDTALIGLFDRDDGWFEAYRDAIDARDGKLFEEDKTDGDYLKVKYRKRKVYSVGMLYPVPSNRISYYTPTRDFQKENISIEVEFYFKDDEIKNILGFKNSVDDSCSDAQGKYTKLNISSKKTFADKVTEKAASLDFSDFGSLFGRLEEILTNAYSV